MMIRNISEAIARLTVIEITNPTPSAPYAPPIDIQEVIVGIR